jgi:hypothetical protein
LLLPDPPAAEAAAWLPFGAAAELQVVLAALLIVRVGGLDERPAAADGTSAGAALPGLLCGLEATGSVPVFACVAPAVALA